MKIKSRLSKYIVEADGEPDTWNVPIEYFYDNNETDIEETFAKLRKEYPNVIFKDLTESDPYAGVEVFINQPPKQAQFSYNGNRDSGSNIYLQYFIIIALFLASVLLAAFFLFTIFLR